VRRLDWAEYRRGEFEGIDPAQVIAILPTAAIEQHGPHLPVGVDAMIAEGMLGEFRRQCPEDLDVRILPVQAVGKSNEHLDAAGTLTLTAETALASWVQIGLSVARAGVRKIVIVNSHGGNLDLVSILARELRVRAGMLAVKCQWSHFGLPEGIYGQDEAAYGIHAGDKETSLMLHFHPELVDKEAVRDFRSAARDWSIPPVGAVSRGWMARDLHPSGAVGAAHLATAQKGRSTCLHQVAGFIALLRKVRDIPLDGLEAFPSSP
jgi:creatinine amidohydrolase